MFRDFSCSSVTHNVMGDVGDGPLSLSLPVLRLCAACVLSEILALLTILCLSLVVINCDESDSSFFIPFPTGGVENV